MTPFCYRDLFFFLLSCSFFLCSFIFCYHEPCFLSSQTYWYRREGACWESCIRYAVLQNSFMVMVILQKMKLQGYTWYPVFQEDFTCVLVDLPHHLFSRFLWVSHWVTAQSILKHHILQISRHRSNSTIVAQAISLKGRRLVNGTDFPPGSRFSFRHSKGTARKKYVVSGYVMERLQPHKKWAAVCRRPVTVSWQALFLP